MSFEFLKICPKCSSEKIVFSDNKKYFCSDCNFTYYINVAAAVAVIIESGSKIIVIRRNINPHSGKLDLPGGFVDPGESLEQAAKRELLEELKLQIENLEYLGSYSNIYTYKSISYNTADAVFITKIRNPDLNRFSSEISEVILMEPEVINEEHIAFDSLKKALRDYIELRKSKNT